MITPGEDGGEAADWGEVDLLKKPVVDKNQ